MGTDNIKNKIIDKIKDKNSTTSEDWGGDNEQGTIVLKQERETLLDHLEDWLEVPMVVLGFLWLVLTIVEFVGNLSPFLEKVNLFIWIIFIIDFIIKFSLAPIKTRYLKKNWLTMIALAVPALRVFRISRALSSIRFLRAPSGLRLFRIVSTFNRGMGALGRSLGRRGFGYVLALTLIVGLLGAAGMYAFERDSSEYFHDYGTALWWTAMVLTTMGSDYFPKTSEGRLLCLLLAIYGFAVFGYVTATVASFFVEREATNPDSDVASAAMIQALREDIRELNAKLDRSQLRQE